MRRVAVLASLALAVVAAGSGATASEVSEVYPFPPLNIQDLDPRPMRPRIFLVERELYLPRGVIYNVPTEPVPFDRGAIRVRY